MFFCKEPQQGYKKCYESIKLNNQEDWIKIYDI